MKIENTEELLERTRRVYRREEYAPEIPVGFAGRVLAARLPKPLIILQWTSCAGVAVAAAVAILVTLRSGNDTVPENVTTNLWMEMPMSENF